MELLLILKKPALMSVDEQPLAGFYLLYLLSPIWNSKHNHKKPQSCTPDSNVVMQVELAYNYSLVTFSS